MDFLQRRANRQCKIIGEKGSLRWDLNANSVVLESSKGEEVIFSQLNFDRNDMYLEQLRGFIRVAAGEILPRITVDEGLEVLRLIEGIRRSSKSGLPVALSPHSLSAQ
jgi:predicted dehydrogenase